MTPDMMVVTDLDGQLVEAAPGRKPSSEIQMHLVAYRERPDDQRGRPRASAALDRLRGGRHPARSRGAGRGRDDARQHSDRGVRHAVDARAGRTRWRRTSRRTTGCCSPTTARSRSARICSRRTTRWRRSSTSRASAWSRACSGASICCRARKSMRLQGAARHLRHRRARADLSRPGGRRRSDVPGPRTRPSSPGDRLVPDTSVARRASARSRRYGRRDSANIRPAYGARR